MAEQTLFSLRMRAAAGGAHEQGGRHLSGGERLVAANEVEAAALALLRRARERGPDFVRLTVERVPAAQVERIPCLPVTTVAAPDPAAARAIADELIGEAGVSVRAIETAFALLTGGTGGAPMRGAALIDAASGERREPDPRRGVRVSHFDYAPDARPAAQRELARHGLTHHRTLEALALASKVIGSGVLAELCWSDDADYMAGYVATAGTGYVRFPAFRPAGATGGRVFFLRPGAVIADCLERLERRPVLIEGPVVVRRAVGPATIGGFRVQEG
jgi:6-carboxyhexanoate--CoA ligase